MDTRLRRTGPRFTILIDLNFDWLKPALAFNRRGPAKGLGYFHLGWLTALFGFGKARDAIWDNFLPDEDVKEPPKLEIL